MKINKIIIFSLIFVINIPASVSEAAQVYGDVWGVWDSTMNPIEVIGELRVPPDSSLIIGPGCYIEFQDYYALTLDTSAAFIRAIGTEEDSIIFTSAFGRVWNGIDIYSADTTCEFSYCVIEKAYVNIEDIFIGSGGAIHCELTDLNIRNCRISNNRSLRGFGGGIFIYCANIYISNSIVSNNFCAFGGSGIYSGFCIDNGKAEIINNIFENDTTFYPLGSGNSGAVECTYCTDIVFKENIVKNNLSYGVGAVLLSSSVATISKNVLRGNLGWAGRSGFFITVEDSGLVAYNEITYNGNVNSGGFEGSGLALFGFNTGVYNNIITFNETGSFAGGVYLAGSNNSFINNIIAYNRAYNGGGIYIDNTSNQIPNILKNNIIWGNFANYNPQIFNEGNRPLEILYCDVEGGWPGVGNIDIDPLFRDTAGGDFHLMATYCGDPYDSPCIDVGDPTIQDYLLECDWGLGFLPSDMGAYGGGDSTLQLVDDFQFSLPEKSTLLRNYPNPFNASTNIEFALLEASYISISIYDILGREVELLYEGNKQPGVHAVYWSAKDHPSGVYFARMETGGITKTIKIMLLK
ncbi:MAG: T9SS type A sorting domain-containing protein [Candidatus Zixiibacteriota bacterium]|nr:MAG: T9SS type A sorting domain-containing protein [candidate division Zixibacteria bacterium]